MAVKELCETTDFFEPDRTYVDYGSRDDYGVKETYGEFWCKVVYTHPHTRQLLAVGLWRNFAEKVWVEQAAYTMTLEEWRNGYWCRTFYEDKEQVQE